MKMTVELEPVKGGMSAPEVVEIYLDRESLGSLLERLSNLKEIGDHARFMTPSWGRDDLSEDKCVSSNTLAHHLKVTLV